MQSRWCCSVCVHGLCVDSLFTGVGVKTGGSFTPSTHVVPANRLVCLPGNTAVLLSRNQWFVSLPRVVGGGGGAKE